MKNCRRHAVVCRGGLQNNWWHKSQHLKASGMTQLNMTDGDRLTLQGLIEMRLGNAALQMTHQRLSSARWRHFLLSTKIASFYVSHIWYEGVTLAHGRWKSQNTRYANDVAEFVYLHIDQ